MYQLHLYDLAISDQHELIADVQSCVAATAARRDRRRARKGTRSALHVAPIASATGGEVIAIPQRFDDAA